MDNIIEPNFNFDFSKIHLAHPSSIQGGAYFTKILHNSKPLYIQTTQSLSRQGFIKTGKKYYIDLMFDNNSSELINWFENLEEKCKQLIFDKSEVWFQNTLDINDVETAFNSIIRIYKSGKYYLVRTNARSNSNGDPYVKIYNENEEILTTNDINNETKIISILEIQGIKFTSRNFQIEIEIKQIMIVNDEIIFDNCLIKTNKQSENNNLNNKKVENDNISTNNNKVFTNTLEEIKELDILENLSDENLSDEIILDYNNKYEDANNLHKNISYGDQNINCEDKTKEYLVEKNINDSNNITNKSDDNLELEIEELDNIIDDSKELKEVDLNIDLANNLETLTLKKPNQVYFDLYKEARNKAKIAKKAAIVAYLEAKNIKKTYMIDNLNDSDSDFDAEIDDVSESELEGL
jgi:hypothetical protein